MAEQKGKGGLRHQEIQKIITDYFRAQGKVAVIEGFIGKNVDVLVFDNEKTVAIEIQLCTTHCLQVKKDLELGCDAVWIVCESAKVIENIKSIFISKLNPELLKKIEFKLSEDFIQPNLKS